MALPDNVASSLAIPDTFLVPDGNRTSRVEDFERGGIAVNDPSQGLNVQDWRGHLNDAGNQVVLTPETGSPYVVLSTPGITELAVAFDVNMRPTVAFIQNFDMKLYWFDSVVGGYVTTTIGPTSTHRSPRLTLDDKREVSRSIADVLFVYFVLDELRYRQQRDRYQVERVLRTGVPLTTKLRNVGMGRGLRIQFELVD